MSQKVWSSLSPLELFFRDTLIWALKVCMVNISEKTVVSGCSGSTHA